MKLRESAAGRIRCGELGEDRLLAQILPDLPRNRSVLLGPGDDCAVVETEGGRALQLLKTDCIVEGVHFAKESAPTAVGWKAMARALSDFAAMSGQPRFALVTLVAPPEKTLDWVRKIYRGLGKAARRFDVAIVGGETSRTKGPAMISVSVTGFVEKGRWVGRAGGKANDELFVTGRLGGSLRGRHLKFSPRIDESRWLTERFSIHAMMDLSDGLGTDLPRLAKASGVGFEVDDAALPLNPGCTTKQAISDGEDYELLFAVGPEDSHSLAGRWKRKFPNLPLTRIGRLIRKSKTENRKLPPGYVHFKER